MSVDWAAVQELPAYVRAAMRALHLRAPDYEGLAALDVREWKMLLEWLDRQQMTLLFGHACAGRLPEEVERSVASRLSSNRLRRARLEEEYRCVAEALAAAGVPHVVLKGFTHGPPYVPAPELRPQYDLDLLVEGAAMERARRALETLGFEQAQERGSPPTDHSPPMVRRTGWRWSGDYFDPEIPTVVELHHRLWDADTEGFDVPDLRNAAAGVCGDPPALEAADRVGYAAAHALRHLLRGSLKTLHIYELARYLDGSAVEGKNIRVDGSFAIVFGLTHEWFGGRLPDGVEQAVKELRAPIRRWLASYAASPLSREFRPSKHELWLQLELVEGWKRKLKAVRRRLAPMALPGRLEGQYDRGRSRIKVRLLRGMRYAGFACRRAAFHGMSLSRALVETGRWLKIRNA